MKAINLVIILFVFSCAERKEIDFQSEIFFNLSEVKDIENAVRNLSLIKNDLKSIPHQVYDLSNLKWLVLAFNDIEEIDIEICKLKRLRILDLTHNNLKSINLGCLDSLEKLNLRNNELEMVHGDIKNNKLLKELIISNNKIISGIEYIGALSNLEVLFMDNSNLQEFPIELTHLQNLRRLDVSFNQIKDLPSEIVNLTSLEYLNLESTDISQERVAEIQSMMLWTEIYY